MSRRKQKVVSDSLLSSVLGLWAPSLGQEPGETLDAVPANGLLVRLDDPCLKFKGEEQGAQSRVRNSGGSGEGLTAADEVRGVSVGVREEAVRRGVRTEGRTGPGTSPRRSRGQPGAPSSTLLAPAHPAQAALRAQPAVD